MSFLTEAAATGRRLAATAVPRTLALSSPAAAQRAPFSCSAHFQKNVTDSAKDTLKSVDRAVADRLVDGINISSKCHSWNGL